VDCLDLACIIGKVVASGNVPRSALMTASDANDIPFIQAMG
jgi:hypothetical protein